MDRQIGVEDMAGLKSRVSWGAIFAGSVIAIAVYLMISLFVAGAGLSAADANNTDGRTAGWITLAAGAIALIGSMFIGGYVTTVLTAGENRQEALIHGVLTWAVVTVMAASALGSVLKAGASAVTGAGMVAADAARANTDTNWEQAARNAGVPQERIDQLKQGLNPDNVRAQAENAKAQVNDPQNREDARKAAATAAWVTLAATLISVGSAIWGALAGAGPTFQLFPVAVAQRREVVVSRN